MPTPTIEEKLQALEAYMTVKLSERDWHGVRDAVVDIELLERELECRKRSEARELGRTNTAKFAEAVPDLHPAKTPMLSGLMDNPKI